MATQLEYALMAGAAYVSTRADINKIPVPRGNDMLFGDEELTPGGTAGDDFLDGGAGCSTLLKQAA